MQQEFDAIVVGAGPAGSACGYVLAKAGLEVLLVERGKFPGAKNMWGGAFYGPTLARLLPGFWEEAPLERCVTHHRFSTLTEDACFTAEFTTRRFDSPPYNGFTLLRSRFDRWLASKVEEAGGIVAAGLHVDGLLRDGGRIVGIRAGGDELPAKMVVACDGANSMLAREAGLRGDISPTDMKQGVKEVLELPQDTLERRFNLAERQGVAWEFIGSCTQGLPGGGFIYTNKESLSVGVVVQLSALAEHNITANELLTRFKEHPHVAPYLSGATLAEYSAHLIPASGLDMMPRLYTDGLLVAGDAAALVVGTGLVLEGANFAVASGVAAAETIIGANEKNDFTTSSLADYQTRLERSFVLKDLKTYRGAHRFLETPRIYSTYPDLVCDVAEKIFTNDGAPRRRTWRLVQEAMDGRVSWWQVARDLVRAKGAI